MCKNTVNTAQTQVHSTRKLTVETSDVLPRVKAN